MAFARGIRNNNPGNIRSVSGTTWKGQIGVDNKGFVIFDTMQNGFRAMYITLRTYRFKYGIRTIQDIVTRYAPSNENDTAAYISSVSKQTGIAPDTVLALDQYPAVMAAIGRQETGQSFDVALAQKGVSLA